MTLLADALGLIAFGTVGFYVLILLVNLIFIGLVETKHYILPGFITVLLALFYWKTLTAVNWQCVVIFVVVYGLLGALWSLFRWFRYVKEVSNDFQKTYGGTSLTKHDLARLKEKIEVYQHKGVISSWIFYWPWSLVWNIFGDLVTSVFEALQKSYSRIAQHQLKKFTIKPDERDDKTDCCRHR